MDKELLPLLCGLAILSAAAALAAPQRQAPGLAESVQGAIQGVPQAARSLADQAAGARLLRTDQVLHPAGDEAESQPDIGELPVFELSHDALPCAGSDSLRFADGAPVCAWAI